MGLIRTYNLKKKRPYIKTVLFGSLLAPPALAGANDGSAGQPGISADQITSGFYKKAENIESCIVSELEKNSDLPSEFTISFCVNNSGFAVETELLERQVRTTQMATCIRSSLESEKSWPSYAGEVQCADFPMMLEKS